MSLIGFYHHNTDTITLFKIYFGKLLLHHEKIYNKSTNSLKYVTVNKLPDIVITASDMYVRNKSISG